MKSAGNSNLNDNNEVTEEVITKATTVEPEKANDNHAEQAGTDFQCDLCDFSSNWENGLSVHMARKSCNH